MLFKTEQLKFKHDTSSSPKYLCCTICIEIILRLKELIFANYLKTHISVLFLVLAFVWPVCVFLCSRKFLQQNKNKSPWLPFHVILSVDMTNYGFPFQNVEFRPAPRWLSGRRTTSSSRRCTRWGTPRWQNGWRMLRRFVFLGIFSNSFILSN